jgi:hypothetical protein
MGGQYRQSKDMRNENGTLLAVKRARQLPTDSRGIEATSHPMGYVALPRKTSF